MGQDVFDLIIILMLVFFSLRGFSNGFVGEVAGVVSLVGGFWAAYTYHPLVSRHLTAIADPGWRTLAAYVLIFLAVILLVALLARILQKILSFSFVTWADKLAGCIMGLLKGALICTPILLILQKFFHDAPFMQHSRVLPYFDALMQQVRGYLPADIVARLGL